MCRLETSVSDLQQSSAQQVQAMVATSRALTRQQHLLDEGLAQTAEAFDRHRENVGTAVTALDFEARCAVDPKSWDQFGK